MRTTATVLLMSVLSLGAFAAEVSEEEMRAAREEVERARQALLEATRDLNRMMPEAVAPARRALEMVRREERPMIGVVMAESPDRKGVRLAAVTPGGPADEAGLESGDVIVSINGTSLKGSNAVDRAYELLDGMEEGDEFDLVVRTRDGKERNEKLVAELHQPRFSVGMEGDYMIAPTIALSMDRLREDLDRLKGTRLAPLPAISGFSDDRFHVWNFGWRWSGLEMARLNPQLGRYFGAEEGALVLSTEGLDDADLQPGDVIVSVDGEVVTTPREVMRRLRDIDAGQQADLGVIRDGKSMQVAVTAPEPRSYGFSYGWSTDDED